jgi:uncharacterized protein YceH (UPF0502 family)
LIRSTIKKSISGIVEGEDVMGTNRTTKHRATLFPINRHTLQLRRITLAATGSMLSRSSSQNSTPARLRHKCRRLCCFKDRQNTQHLGQRLQRATSGICLQPTHRGRLRLEQKVKLRGCRRFKALTSSI